MYNIKNYYRPFSQRFLNCFYPLSVCFFWVLYVSYRYDAHYLLIFQSVSPNSECTLLHNHSTSLQVREQGLLQGHCLILRPHWGFTSYPINGRYLTRIQLRVTYYIQLSL